MTNCVSSRLFWDVLVKGCGAFHFDERLNVLGAEDGDENASTSEKVRHQRLLCGGDVILYSVSL